MDPIHKKILTKLRVYLADNLTISQRFLDFLREADILTLDHQEVICAKATSREKIVALLDYLPRRGSKSYDAFINALYNTSQQFIIDELQEKETELRAGGKDDQHLPRYAVPASHSETGPGIDVQDAAHQGSRYPVTTKPRGLVLMINNHSFQTNTFADRLGSDVDVEMLRVLFEDLGYSVAAPELDLSANEMEDSVLEFSKLEDLNEVSACIVILMSHGGKDTIFGVDGVPVNLYKLFDYFNVDKCTAMRNKPKFFIVQACRGRRQDCQGLVLHDGPKIGQTGTPTNVASEIVPTEDRESHNLPANADRLIAYASTPGFEALRHSEEGSWFVQALCPIFRNHFSSMSVTDMLIEVNGVVAKDYVHKSRKMMPTQENNLTKRFFL